MSEAAVKIRPARESDVGAIVRLWREMWDFHAPYEPRFQATPATDVAMASWVRMHLEGERSIVLVAESPSDGLDGYCLGMILDNFPGLPAPLFGRISEIAVHRRREGIGTNLLEAMHARFRERGVPYVEVDVSVKNPVARAFWRKHGYGEFLERLRLDF
jgi:ribosomal protein S18 acetylase RimI-like enzyme